jgi:hypothetical protein
MSYDLAVFYPGSRRLSDEEAMVLYEKLCEDEDESLTPHDSVDAFYEELYSIHPEIDDVSEEDLDDCPWSVAHDRYPTHVMMSCIFPQAEQIDDLIRRLARKHGLAVLNPQSGSIIYPS